MRKITCIVCAVAFFSSIAFAQTFITPPVRIDSTKKGQRLDVTYGSYQITPGSQMGDSVGIWVAWDTTGQYLNPGGGMTSKGVDSVTIEGNGATVIGKALELGTNPGNRDDGSFGVWLKNKPAVSTDTTEADTVRNLVLRNWNWGVSIRLSRLCVVDNCTIDNTREGIQTGTYGRGHKFTNNVMTNMTRIGMSLRGLEYTLENNRIANVYAPVSGDAWGIYLNSSGSAPTRYALSKNNVVDSVGAVGAGLGYGIIFTGGTYQNTSDGDSVKNCDVGLMFAAVADSANTIQNAVLLNDSIGIRAIGARNTLVKTSKISGGTTQVNLQTTATMTLENVDFDTSSVTVIGTTSLLTVKYDLNIHVNDFPASVEVWRESDAVRVDSGAVDGSGDYTLAGLVRFTQSPSGRTWITYKVKVWRVTSDSVTGLLPYLGLDYTFTNLLPVQLTSFEVLACGMDAMVRWTTVTETNCLGFEVERRTVSDGEQASGGWHRVGFVAGAGTSTSPQEYSYADMRLMPGRYAYRIRQINQDGSSSYYGGTEVDIGAAPRVLALNNNYPNPFNPLTTVTFTVPEDGHAALRVYNVLGQEVAVPFDRVAKAGKYEVVEIDGSRLASGAYYYVLQFGSQSVVKRMLLVR